MIARQEHLAVRNWSVPRELRQWHPLSVAPEHGTQVLSAFELSDEQVVFPNDTTAVMIYKVRQEVSPRGGKERTVQEMNDTSTWIKSADGWKCVTHTETPAQRGKH